MKVLIACEFSGIVRNAFISRGHDAWSCDLLLLDTEQEGNHHIKGDVLEHLDDGWDLMIAHPPCTRLANSGVQWLKERNLWSEMAEAADFFRALWEANIPKICVENPVPHGYAGLPKYNQIIEPWQFGQGETKKTCLWLKNLPKLKPTKIVEGREQRVFKESPGPDRWKNRSRTYAGIAEAMARQWG